MLDKNKNMCYNKEVKSMGIKVSGRMADALEVTKVSLGECEEGLNRLEAQVGMLEDINNRLQKCVVGETMSVDSIASECLHPNALDMRLSRLEDRLGAVIKEYSEYVEVIEKKLGKMILQG